jgi:hypothetical protein
MILSMALLKHPLIKRQYSEIINIGNGQEYQMQEVVRLVGSITKCDVMPEMGALPYHPRGNMALLLR